MLQTVKPNTSTNKEQLLAALVASLKMLLVALALIIVVVALFSKAIVGLGMVALQACNLLLAAAISFVASAPAVQEFASFLAMPQ